MARTKMKTISTSLNENFLRDLAMRSGIDMNTIYVSISILMNDNLLDDIARKELLLLFPELKGYESRKTGYKDFNMDDFTEVLMDLIEQTFERIKEQKFGGIYKDVNELLANNEILTHPLVEDLRKLYEQDIKKLKAIIEELKKENNHTEQAKKVLEMDLLAAPTNEEIEKLKEINGTLTIENKKLKDKLQCCGENCICSPKSSFDENKSNIIVEMDYRQQIEYEKKRNEELSKENTKLHRSLKILKEKQIRSGPLWKELSEKVESNKEQLKNLQKNNDSLHDEMESMKRNQINEIKIRDVQIGELEELLAKALEKKDDSGQMKEYNIYLESSEILQKLHRKADNIRPIINRLKKSTPRTDINVPLEVQQRNLDANYAVYLLKKRKKEFYFARIIEWSYNHSASEWYINSNGEKEYLSYTVTTEKLVNGKWVRNRSNENISYNHLITRAVDNYCVPLLKYGFKNILKALYHENKDNRLTLPSIIAQPIIPSYFAKHLFKIPLVEYFKNNNIKSKNEQYILARYILHLVKYYNHEVSFEYLRELEKFIAQYNKE